MEQQLRIMEETRACRACLATDVKLYDMLEYKLISSYEMVVGTEWTSSPEMPHHLCSYCAALIAKCSAFQERCRTAQQLLTCAVLQEHVITTDYIRAIDREAHGLSLSLYCKYNLTVKEETEDLEKMFNDIFKENDIKVEANTASSDEETLAKLVEKTKTTKKRKKKRKTRNDSEEHFDNVDMSDDLCCVDVKEEIDIDIPMELNFQLNPKIDLVLNSEMNVVTLTKEEQIQELQLRKESENYKNSFFKCEYCFKGFLMESTFKNHMDRHDPSYGSLSCEICHIRWTDRRSLQSHVLSTHLRKYICRRCGHVSKCVQRAKDHCKWHEGVTYICEICGSTFHKYTSYLTHIRIHHPSGHVCTICDTSFVSETGLKLHWNKAHKNDSLLALNESFKCGSCAMYFKNGAALEKHTSLSVDNTCDTNFRPCTYCGDNFENEAVLKEHIKTHQKDEPVKCIECNKEFSTPRCYAAHYQRIHLQIKPTNNKKHSQTDVVCEICGLKCMSRATLVYHQRIHSGEKPFECSECPKRFTVYQRLQIHMRTHTGERPFRCSRCPKAFMHKAALNRHDRVHTGAKPYSCPHCNKTFSQSNSMKIHVRGVHLKLPALYRRAIEK